MKAKTPPALRNWKFRRVLGAPRRWARRRGFGIHSPFAFDFVRRVIASPCRYYCYDRLGRLARQSEMSGRTLRLLFRLALFFRPARYAVAGPAPSGLQEAIAEGFPRAESGLPADMLIVNGQADEAALLATIRRRGTIVILNLRDNTEILDTLWRITDRGMLFRGASAAIFVAQPHLPHQAFSIWI